MNRSRLLYLCAIRFSGVASDAIFIIGAFCGFWKFSWFGVVGLLACFARSIFLVFVTVTVSIVFYVILTIFLFFILSNEPLLPFCSVHQDKAFLQHHVSFITAFVSLLTHV